MSVSLTNCIRHCCYKGFISTLCLVEMALTGYSLRENENVGLGTRPIIISNPIVTKIIIGTVYRITAMKTWTDLIL